MQNINPESINSRSLFIFPSFLEMNLWLPLECILVQPFPFKSSFLLFLWDPSRVFYHVDISSLEFHDCNSQYTYILSVNYHNLISNESMSSTHFSSFNNGLS